MKTSSPERLADDAELVDNLARNGGTGQPDAVDRIACRLLEHVTGVEQSPTHATSGPLPAERLEAIEKLYIENRREDGTGLRSVTLSPRLAGAIAIQLADYAETLHHLQRNAGTAH